MLEETLHLILKNSKREFGVLAQRLLMIKYCGDGLNNTCLKQSKFQKYNFDGAVDITLHTTHKYLSFPYIIQNNTSEC